MKPKLAQATKPSALQSITIVEQPLSPSRGRTGGRRWRPLDIVLLVGLVVSLAVLSVSIAWSLRPVLKEHAYAQAHCEIVKVRQMAPRDCQQLPQCYPGSQFYNDDDTGWCRAIEAGPDEQNVESDEDENKSPHALPLADIPDDVTGPTRDGPPHDRSHERPADTDTKPHHDNWPWFKPKWPKHAGPRSQTTSGPEQRQRDGEPCATVDVEVHTRSGETWTSVLYSRREAEEKCDQCSFTMCTDGSIPTKGDSLSCYYHRDHSDRVFGGHLERRWNRRRIHLSIIFVTVFFVLLVARRGYVRWITPTHKVNSTGGVVIAMPSVDGGGEKSTTTHGLSSSDGDAGDPRNPPKYSEVAAFGCPPAYDEALAPESNNELVLTPVVQY